MLHRHDAAVILGSSPDHRVTLAYGRHRFAKWQLVAHHQSLKSPNLERTPNGLSVFSFARFGASLDMRVEGVCTQNKRLRVRQREKGGKRQGMPCHHALRNVDWSEGFSDARIESTPLRYPHTR